MTEYIFTKEPRTSEITQMCLKAIGRTPDSQALGGKKLTLTFDPPLTVDERVLIDQRFSKMGYYMVDK